MVVKKLTDDSYGLVVDYDELSIKKAVIAFMRRPNLDTFTKLVCAGVTEEHLRGYKVYLHWGVRDDIKETIDSMLSDGDNYVNYVNYRGIEDQYFKYLLSVLSLAPWIVHYLSPNIVSNLNSMIKHYDYYRGYFTDELLDELIIRRLRSYYYVATNEYAGTNNYTELYLDLKHIDSHTYKHNGLNSFDRGMYNAKFTNVLSESIITNYAGSDRFSRHIPLSDALYAEQDRVNNLIKALLLNSKHNVVKDIGNLVLNHMNWVDVLNQTEVIYKGPTEPCRDEYSVFSSQDVKAGDFFNMRTKYYDKFLDY